MTKTRAHVYVTGRVQGIFYRSFVRTKAQLLNLRGWVKNTMDGCVEIVFEGETEDINSAIEECRRGPTHAQITDLRVEWEKPRGEFNNFEIKQ
jgi:acylphosphatase